MCCGRWPLCWLSQVLRPLSNSGDQCCGFQNITSPLRTLLTAFCGKPKNVSLGLGDLACMVHQYFYDVDPPYKSNAMTM